MLDFLLLANQFETLKLRCDQCDYCKCQQYVECPRRKISLSAREKIQDICGCLILNDDKLKHIMKLFEKSVEQGLDKEGVKTAAVKMLPSYVRSVPNGTEVGEFLALDLGGTNFRVLLIKLDGKKAEMISKIFRVPVNKMVGTGEQLFDHIASCMADFMRENNMDGNKTMPLGFTFSFPCQQDGLTVGKLITWTKGFKATDVEGKDVVQLLKEAVDRRPDVSIDVVAILNDTTGTLMACAHGENSCNLGIIVGTGTNACYMEKIRKCNKLDGIIDPNDGGPDEVIINTEWGAFGDDGVLEFMRTRYDKNVDENSINAGHHLFEKMISGMYMGELVRLVLAHLVEENVLFDGHESAEVLFERGKFPTKLVSEIELDLEDDERNFAHTFEILEDLGIEQVSIADCANVAYVSTRAAYMTAAVTAVLLNRMRKPFVTVGVDGSVYRFHPTFKKLMDQKISQLIDEDLEFQLMLSEDGSGRGAALVAAVACRVAEEKAAHQEKLAAKS